MSGNRDFALSHPNGELLGRQLNTAQRMIHDQKGIVELARFAVIESTGEERADYPDQQALEGLWHAKFILKSLREKRNAIRNELGINRRSAEYDRPPGENAPNPRMPTRSKMPWLYH